MAVLRDYAVEGRRVLNYLQAPSFDWSRQGLQGTTFAAEGQMGVPGPYQDDTRLVVEAEDASSGTLTATCRPSNQFESILDTPFHYHRHFAEEYCTLMLAAPLWVLTSIDGIPTVDVRRPGEAFWAAVEPRAPAQPLSFWTLYGEQEWGHVTLYLGLPCLPDELAYPCEDTRGVHLNLAFFGADGAALPGPWTRPGWRTLAFEVPDGRSDAGLRAFVWTPADDWVAYIPNRGGTGHWVMFRGTLRVTAAFGSVAPVAPVPEDVRQHIVTALGGGGSAWLVDVHAGAQGLHAVPGVYGAPSESSAVPDLPVRSTAQGFAMRVEMPREAPPTLLLNVPWAVLPKAQRSGDGLDVQWQTDLSVGRDVARLRRVPLEELATGGEGGRYAAVVSEEALHLLIRPGAGGPAELMVTSGAGQEPRGVPFPYESLLAVVAVGALLGRRRRARGAPPAEGP